MANLKTSIITNEGLNTVNAWGSVGSNFSIKYFLPVYDPSIDNTIHSNTQALTQGLNTDVQKLSATVSATDTSATIRGEKIWNAQSSIVQLAYNTTAASDVYMLSEGSEYVITSAENVQGGLNHNTNPTVTIGASITSSSQNIEGRINLVNFGVSALSTAYSATNFTSTTSGTFTGNVQVVPKAPRINLQNRNMLYRVNSYAGVNLSANDPNVDAGRYQMQLDADHGSFKFNKIVLYLAKFNNQTEDTSVLPVPFAEMVFEGTQVKESNNENGGANLVWETVVDLIFGRDNNTTNLTILQWDNWNYLSDSFGLMTGNKVAIVNVSANPGVWQPSARLDVVDKMSDQLRLAYDTNADARFTVNASGMTISASDAITLLSNGNSAWKTDGELVLSATEGFTLHGLGGGLGTSEILTVGDLNITSQVDVNIEAVDLTINAGDDVTIKANDVMTISATNDLTILSTADVNIVTSTGLGLIFANNITLTANDTVNLLAGDDIVLSATDDISLLSTSDINIVTSTGLGLIYANDITLTANDTINLITNDSIDISAVNDVNIKTSAFYVVNPITSSDTSILTIKGGTGDATEILTNQSKLVISGADQAHIHSTIYGYGNQFTTGLVEAYGGLATGNATFYYTEYSFNVSVGGFTNSPFTCACEAVKIGKQVTIRLPAIYQVSNSNTFEISGFPASIVPALTYLLQPVTLIDNTNDYYSGTAYSVYQGIISFFVTSGAGSSFGFTTTGNKGFFGAGRPSITYYLP